MKNILIYQRVLPHYRISFFEALYDYLNERELTLKVVVGYEREGTVPKTVLVDKPWVEYRKNNYVNLFGRELVFQRFLLSDLKFDGIIIEQSNRLLLNYVLFLLSVVGLCKVAYWGHGKNYQSNKPSGFRERFKCIFSKWVDWWFAYTIEAGKYIESIGYSKERITSVSNSIDTRALTSELERLKGVDCFQPTLHSECIRRGIYCGGMYPEKKLGFLFLALDEIKTQYPEFEFTFIGSGPDEVQVQYFCAERNWCEYLGPITDLSRVKYFLAADVFLMPGLVGLAVLDSFALETPMVTTDIRMHSPEIEYLVDGLNGVVTHNDVGDYAKSVVSLLKNKETLESLKAGCRDSAKYFTVENMANNFASGVIEWMELER